jgi:hypothetical protein
LAVLTQVLDGVPVAGTEAWVLSWLAQWDVDTVAAVAALMRATRCHPAPLCPVCARELISGRSLRRLPPPTTAAAGDRPDPCDDDELAQLLAEVVMLAGDSAWFPGRWQHLAELAMEHDRVRRAVCALARDAGVQG